MSATKTGLTPIYSLEKEFVKRISCQIEQLLEEEVVQTIIKLIWLRIKELAASNAIRFGLEDVCEKGSLNIRVDEVDQINGISFQIPFTESMYWEKFNNHMSRFLSAIMRNYLPGILVTKEFKTSIIGAHGNAPNFRNFIQSRIFDISQSVEESLKEYNIAVNFDDDYIFVTFDTSDMNMEVPFDRVGVAAV